MTQLDFRAAFEGLTGHEPFQWQRRLFERFCERDLPATCDIPTGLGKTSVIPIWLIALAFQQLDDAPSRAFPRRLVYVVDRRTVVDQATDLAEEMRSRVLEGHAPAVAEGLRRLSTDTDDLLGISTLRGEFADNGEWQKHPARAAIIVGTVDMIGSRLLFSGYGISRRMRPFHAGLLGHDVLLVHDEGHLSPAFGKLIKDLEKLQAGGFRPFRAMELSATQRGASSANVFTLTAEEQGDQDVMRRINARKSLIVHSPRDPDDPAGELAERALKHEAGQSRVVVYLRAPDLVRKVAALLPKDRTAILTGTIRGYERDLMASTRGPLDEIEDDVLRRRAEVFRGFRAGPDRKPPERTEYLVATSAGEVGIDLDADHMVSDLTTLDSMIQRLGRVNRLGRGSATVVVVELPRQRKKGDDDSPDDEMKRIAATRAALETLTSTDPGRDCSPRALRNLVKRLGADGVRACFSREPRMVGLTDILLDGWAMTRFKDLPGRPPVERWLHGITSEPPSVYVAWREEVDEIVNSEDLKAGLSTLFDKHPVLVRERLRAPLRDDVIGELAKIARRLGEREVILLPGRGDPLTGTLTFFLKSDSRGRLREATIVLPRDAGGLDSHGMLDGGEVNVTHPDVADFPFEHGLGKNPSGEGGQPERARVLLTQDGDTGEWTARRLGSLGQRELEFGEQRPRTLNEAAATVRKKLNLLAETGRIVLRSDDETGEPRRVLLILSAKNSIMTVEDNPGAAGGKQLLDDHLAQVVVEAKAIVDRIWPAAAAQADPVADAVMMGAEKHDLGKDREPWQADIGNPRKGRPLAEWKPWAKSGRRGFVSRLSGRYRHEFGSLREAASNPSIKEHPERDLILHLIAAHHGWARPHFEEEHWDIADDVGFGENESVSADVMRRFALLQRRFGWWGLAWLEALVRAADYRASSRVGSDDTDAGGGRAS